jgi:activator of HSP90 ATPase
MFQPRSKELESVRVTTIKQTVIIPAAPDKVYEAFMNARIHSEFTGSKATCNPIVGGRFTAWDGYIFGKNLELEKGKKIVQEWKTTEWPKGYGPSRFELTLKKVKDGTEVIMVHSKVPEEQAAELAEGWNEFYWTPLKEHFSRSSAR